MVARREKGKAKSMTQMYVIQVAGMPVDQHGRAADSVESVQIYPTRSAAYAHMGRILGFCEGEVIGLHGQAESRTVCAWCREELDPRVPKTATESHGQCQQCVLANARFFTVRR